MARSPETLFARYRTRGDVAALAALFDQTAAEVYRVAHYLCGRSADAEDLLQATFLTAIEGRDSFRPGARVVPWLLGILTNKARRLREDRRRERLRNAPAEGSGPVDPTAIADPVAAAVEGELRERLARDLGQLSPALRPVLVLHLLNGLRPADIARALDRPQATVRSQIARGLDALRRSLPAGFAGAAVVGLLPEAARAMALAKVRSAVLASSDITVAPVAAPPVFSFPAASMVILMQTKFVIVALAAALVVGLLGFWQPWQTGGIPADSGAGVASVPLRVGDPRVDVVDGDAGEHRAGLPDRLPVRENGIPGPADGVLVQFVLADTAAPAAATECWFPPPGYRKQATELDQILAGADPDLGAEYRDSGRQIVADSLGRLRLPPYLIEMWTCVATCGEAAGTFDLELPKSSEKPQVVELRVGGRVRVLAVNARGVALPGAPIGIRTNLAARGYYCGTTTGVEGLLELSGLVAADFPKDADGRACFEVVPMVLGERPVGVRVDADPLPSQPVEVRFPPCGRIEIQLRDSRGAAWRRGFAPSGARRSGARHGVYVTLDAVQGGEQLVTADGSGLCVLPFVAVGARISVRLRATGAGILGRIAIRGPREPGEVVRMDLAPPPPTGTVVGRLLDSSGRPVARESLWVLCQEFHRTQMETDAEGRFRVDLRRDGTQADDASRVVCYFTEVESKARPNFAATEIQASVAGREIPVGDLTLAAIPVVAAGRLTNVGSQRVGRSNLQVFDKRTHHRRQPSPQCRVESDHRFTVYGWPEAVKGLLYVHVNGCISQQVPFAVGTKDLAVELVRSADLHVHLPLPPGQDPRSFAARLRPDAATRLRMESLSPRMRLDRRRLSRGPSPGLAQSWWGGIVPGVYQFELFCSGFADPIETVGNLRVRPGKDVLQLGDILHNTRLVSLRVLDPDGQPVRSGWVQPWQASMLRGDGGDVSITSGLAWLGLPSGSADVLVSAPGCRTAVVTGLDANRTVSLLPAIGIRLVIDEGPLPERGGYVFEAELVADESSLPWGGRGGSWIRAGRTRVPARAAAGQRFDVGVPAPGRYSVQVALRRGPSGRRVAKVGDPVAIEVGGGSGQEFRMKLQSGSLQRALDKLQR